MVHVCREAALCHMGGHCMGGSTRPKGLAGAFENNFNFRGVQTRQALDAELQLHSDISLLWHTIQPTIQTRLLICCYIVLGSCYVSCVDRQAAQCGQESPTSLTCSTSGTSEGCRGEEATRLEPQYVVRCGWLEIKTWRQHLIRRLLSILLTIL